MTPRKTDQVKSYDMMAMTDLANQVSQAISNTANTWAAWNQSFSAATGSCIAALNHIESTWAAWNNPRQEEVVRAVRESNVRRDASSEQRETWRQRELETRRAEEAEKEAAKARAEVLLLRHLSPQQKEDLRTKNYFFVEIDGERYRIDRGFAGNVKLIESKGERVRKSFCIHPRIRTPDADAMLAQKLLLEADKESFLRIANVTDYNPPPLSGPEALPNMSTPSLQRVA